MAESAKNAVFQITDAGGVLRTIHCSLSSITMNQSRGIDVLETFCATQKSVGNTDTSFDFSGLLELGSNEIDEILFGLMNDTTPRLFNFYPKGSGSGGVRYYGSGLLESANKGAEVPGFLTVEGTYQVDGNVAREVI
jgi:hypothetical protein